MNNQKERRNKTVRFNGVEKGRRIEGIKNIETKSVSLT